ncbi:Hypothetical protein HVR_LOCUS335 [uncultured virus]|nr:Hypothetical protein HVR_LOCUS335 [uncultured virus]
MSELDKELQRLEQLRHQIVFSFCLDKFRNDECIRFYKPIDLSILLEEKEINTIYSHGYYIPVKHAVGFFECLHQLQSDHPELIIPEGKLERNLITLTSQGHLTSEDVTKIKSYLRHGFTIKDYQKKIKITRSKVGALALSIYYSEKKAFTTNSYVWFKFACKCEGLISYDLFFSYFESITTLRIFGMSFEILDILARSPIRELEIINFSLSHNRGRIKGMSYFIGRSTSLQSITIDCRAECEFLDEEIISCLSLGIQKNASLRQLCISHIELADIHSWTSFIDAITKSGIQYLVITESTIPAVAAVQLLTLMKERPSLIVNVKCSGVDGPLYNEIEELNKLRS